MFWQKLPMDAIRPKYVLDGFPKAGLHLCELMVSPVVQPQPSDAMYRDHWVGTFDGNAWTTDWIPIRATTYRMARLTAGHYVKGHIGHTDDLEQFLYLLGASVVFIYRDLRDVAARLESEIEALGQYDRARETQPRALEARIEDRAGDLRMPVYRRFSSLARSLPARVAAFVGHGASPGPSSDHTGRR